mmetsp:Transcript_24463/g.53797  ORF Transcript_24463/g.53797 Transcript_24463/m.53797 type:complete len:201 (-) Transcript_24463:282-884(-)
MVVVGGHRDDHEAGGVGDLPHALLEGLPHGLGGVGLVAVAHPALHVGGELLPDLLHAHLHPCKQGHFHQIHERCKFHPEPKPGKSDRDRTQDHRGPAAPARLGHAVDVEDDPREVRAPGLDGAEDEVLELAALGVADDAGVLASADPLLLLPPSGEPVADQKLQVARVPQAHGHSKRTEEQSHQQQSNQEDVGRLERRRR